ncbi:glycosyltransferase [Gimesia aquarii]|uniref:Glycosyltransferase EpsE n=1 Tax=Gimesia aquarii TaxID=2527964 RepID=A0A517VZZ1_9PLAN|nr:glycosyltransferase [Gimesia aquarii]QDT98568.1 Putative glycosyltransferase EpsE [Gimesia aquarii]
MQQTNPKVTVLLTVVNPDRHYFPAAVQSILDQSFQDFEFLIVEDPSEKDGRTFLTEEMLDRVVYITNTERTSLVSQKNLGINRARGEYIAMIDADDIAAPDRLKSQVGFLDAHPDITVLGSQIELIDQNGQVIGQRSFPTLHGDVESALRRTVPLCQPSVMLRKSWIKKIGGYIDNGYSTCEDYELWSRLHQAGANFSNHRSKLLRYRIHGSQMKMQFIRDTLQAALYVKRKYWATQMSFLDWVYMLCERAILVLPDKLLYELAMNILYDADNPLISETNAAK